MAAEDKSALTRLLERVAKVEPHETLAVITSFLLFFCVLGGYFAVRPVRETVGTILGEERVAAMFGIVWIVSVAIIPIYGAICARFRRSVFLPWVYAFVALSLFICGFFLLASENNIIVGQFFFVFISVINLFVISVFWSFLLELFRADQTKRLFGFIAAGGTAGAFTGPFLTSFLVGPFGNGGILFMGGTLFLIAVILQRVLLGIWTKHPPSGGGTAAVDRPMGGNPFAGVTLLLKSPYLLGIALFVILLATVSTFLYFEQLRIVRETFADTAERTRVFSRIDFTVQGLTILLQLAFTGRIAARFGVGALLTAVPLAMVLGFLLLAGFNVFVVLAGVMIARRVGEYAFVRPGREMLFSRVDTESKYKAKNLIDVTVYRGGDAVAAQVGQVLDNAGLSPASVMVLGAGVAGAWAVNGFLLGKANRKQSNE